MSDHTEPSPEPPAALVKSDTAPLVPSSDELKGWIARCNGDEPLQPDDERWVDLDNVKVDDHTASLRGEDYIGLVYDCIDLADGESCQLFSGYIGTGKSTELRRLQQMLKNDGYVVLFSNAEDYHDLFSPLSIEQLVVILATAFGEATSRFVGKDVKTPSYLERLIELSRTEIELGSVPLPAPVDLKFEIKHTRPLWLQMRDALDKSLRKLTEHAHAFVRECTAHIRQKRPGLRGVVFVFDSLERLRAPTDQFAVTMDSVVRILSQHSDALTLPGCHSVYTVPPYVEMVASDIPSRYSRAPTVLPAVKLFERGAEHRPYRPGVDALTRIVEQRISLARVFGERRDLLERLVLASGGHLRILLAFLRELLVRAKRKGLPPTDEHVEAVLAHFREKLIMTVRREDAALLDAIGREGTLSEAGVDDLAAVARFMDTPTVLCYRNGGGWYELHPLVREHVARLARSGSDPPAGTGGAPDDR